MPLILIGVLGALVGVAAYEVFVAQVPLSSLVPWWHPSVGTALSNATPDAGTQAALANQAVNQTASPGPKIIALPFAHSSPPPAPVASPHAAVLRVVGLANPDASTAAWQAGLAAAAKTIENGLPITPPDQVSRIQRSILIAFLENLQVAGVTKMRLQQTVVQLSNPSMGPDGNAAAVQLQPFLSTAPPNA